MSETLEPDDERTSARPPASSGGASRRRPRRDERSSTWLLVFPLAVILGLVWVVWILRNPPPIYIPLPDTHGHLCDDGHDASCVELAAQLDDAEAVALLRTSCERGYADACYAAARRSATAQEEVSFARRACDHDHGPGCVLWAKLEIEACENGDCGRTRAAARRSCEMDIRSTPCLLGALIHRYGFLGPVERDDALQLLTRRCAEGDRDACVWAEEPLANADACQAGDGLACYALGLALRDLSMFEAACEHGVREGCDAVRLEVPPSVPMVTLRRRASER